MKSNQGNLLLIKKSFIERYHNFRRFFIVENNILILLILISFITQLHFVIKMVVPAGVCQGEALDPDGVTLVHPRASFTFYSCP